MSVSKKKLILILVGGAVFVALVGGGYVLGKQTGSQTEPVGESPSPSPVSAESLETASTESAMPEVDQSPTPIPSGVPTTEPTPTPTPSPSPEPSPSSGLLLEYNPEMQLRPEAIHILPAATPLPTPLPTVDIVLPVMPRIEIPGF